MRGGGAGGWVLTLSWDVILAFPEDMLGEAGYQGYSCSVGDLLTTVGDPAASPPHRAPLPRSAPAPPTL